MSNSEYIDLQAGWRLRVVTPLGKSGDYRLRYEDVESSGINVTLRAGEFQGYEVAYYRVEARRGGVRVRFTSAEWIRDGVSTPQSRSVLPLFMGAAGRAGLVRLVYLTRVSASDHNMAVLVGETPEALDELTRVAKSNDGRCGTDGRCSWIPPGVAVRPERLGTDGVWTPAR